jgi:hypothetical protein
VTGVVNLCGLVIEKRSVRFYLLLSSVAPPDSGHFWVTVWSELRSTNIVVISAVSWGKFVIQMRPVRHSIEFTDLHLRRHVFVTVTSKVGGTNIFSINVVNLFGFFVETRSV